MSLLTHPESCIPPLPEVFGPESTPLTISYITVPPADEAIHPNARIGTELVSQCLKQVSEQTTLHLHRLASLSTAASMKNTMLKICDIYSLIWGLHLLVPIMVPTVP